MNSKIKNITILSPGETVKGFYNKFTRTDKIALVSSFIIWMFAHLFVFVNDFFIYDSVRLFDTSNGINNGRFLIGPILELFSGAQIPFITGLFSGIIISFAVMFLCRTLKVKKISYIFLISALVVTFPVLYKSNTFLSSIQVFVMALLASVLAVYFANKDTLVGYLASGIFVIVSLACYQAYMPFAVSLFLLTVLIDALENKRVSVLFKRIAITGMVFVVATILYYISWQLLQDVFNVVPADYRGESVTMSSFFSSDIFTRIIEAYVLGVLMCLKGLFYHGNIPIMVIARVIKFLMPFVAIILMFLIIKIKKVEFKNILASLLIFTSLPLAIGLIYILSPFPPHSLMVFTTIIPFLMVIILSDRFLNTKKNIYKILNWIVVVLLAVSIILNVIIGNVGYSLMSSMSKSATSFATRVVDRVESTAGVDVGTKVCFVSDEHWFYSDRYTEKELENKELSMADYFNGFTVVEILGTPYVNSLIWYINDNANYLELEYSYQDLQDGEYSENEQVKALDSFPAKNCSVWINNTLVVKL